MLLGISVSASLAQREQKNLEVICCFVHFPAFNSPEVFYIKGFYSSFFLDVVAVLEYCAGVSLVEQGLKSHLGDTQQIDTE